MKLIRLYLSFGILITLLNGCSVPAPLPETLYFEIQPNVTLNSWPQKLPHLVVKQPKTDALRSGRSIVYSEDQSIYRTYHYRVWSETPARMLQSLFLEIYQDGAISESVDDKRWKGQDAVFFQATIHQFDRVKIQEKWHAVIDLTLSVSRDRNEKPLISKRYRQSISADNDTLLSSVQAFELAIEHILLQWHQDLGQILEKP